MSDLDQTETNCLTIFNNLENIRALLQAGFTNGRSLVHYIRIQQYNLERNGAFLIPRNELLN